MSIKLLALAASYRNDSLNRKLLAHAVKLAHGDGAKVTIIDYEECESIVYRGDDAPLPPGANKLAEALLAHQGLLLASPEYNWSVPGSLKNLIDWLSVDRRAPLAGKTALLMCASPSTRGGISGLQHLRVPLELLGTWVYPQMVGIGSAAGKFEGDELIRDKDQQHLADCVRGFIRATGALTHAA
jgi:NAD(P)H-dependent FMN reductase